jgi:hypothetical protein
MATETTVNNDIRDALMGILGAQDGKICPGCRQVYFNLDRALNEDHTWRVDHGYDIHDDFCPVVKGIAAIKAYREQPEVRAMEQLKLISLSFGWEEEGSPARVLAAQAKNVLALLEETN